MIEAGYRIKCTTATSDVTPTSTYATYDIEYEKQATLDEVEMEMLREELDIPKFKDVLKHHNMLKPNTKIAYKQRSFNIRNAL